MASFDVIAIVLSILGLTASITYYANTLRNQNRTREAQLFMQFFNQFSNVNRDWFKIRAWEWENYDDFLEKYYNNPENWETFQSVSNFMEGLGAYVKEGLISMRLMALFGSNYLLEFWNKFGHIIKEARVRDSNSRYSSETEYLYNELMKYIEKHPEFKP